MKSPNVGKITFALVDIKGGRAAIAKLVGDHKHAIPITLTGEIIGQWSGDDGTSIEFEIDVRKSKLGKPRKVTCHCITCKAKSVTAVKTFNRLARKDRSDPEGGIPGRSL